jgi:BTB/POZ domain
VLFEVHRKNLEVHSEGFAGADAILSSAEKEVVPLLENSAVLELLLQFMYRQPQPDLKTVGFETLAALAEAAEKYQVYSATTLCNIFMQFV